MLKKAGSKISSFLNLKKFNWDYYNSTNFVAQRTYLQNNKELLTTKQYIREIRISDFKYQLKVNELNALYKSRNILSKQKFFSIHKNEIVKIEYESKEDSIKYPYVITKVYNPDGTICGDRLKVYTIDISEHWKRYMDNIKEVEFIEENIKKRVIDVKLISSLESIQEITPETENQIINKKELRMLDEGCILFITDKKALLTFEESEMSPGSNKYRKIVNKLLTIDNINDFIKLRWCYTTFSNIKDLFPLDLGVDYMRRFNTKWLFVKNSSKDSLLVYLRSKIEDKQQYVIIKPGGVMTFLYGDMINSILPDNHPFMSQYSNRTHPEIKN